MGEEEVWVPGPEGWEPEGWERDDVTLRAEAGPEFTLMDHLECLESEARRMVADQYATIDEVLWEAERDPAAWCGPDPTADPGWVDARGRTAGRVRAERVGFAVRAAVLDIAVRLRMSETAVRGRAFTAATLQERCPRVWESFQSGNISESNARSAADAAATLPVDAPDAWAVFDAAVEPSARVLTPGKFRTRVRVVRERVHAESVEVRHRRAAADRSVWVTAGYDGMAVVSALLPVADATAVFRVVDTTARHLRAQAGESRTLAQLRADVFTDRASTATDPGIAAKASVAVTIPVMTLLGQSSEPATLDGYGPIDLETAKRLAGTAPSWVRILTHPVTGTVLDLDRRTYRVPADLRRWLGVTHPTCIAPGCHRAARDCHIDHRIEWQYGGTTAASNLGPLCEPHHGLKTETLWALHDTPHGRRWTSPTGTTTTLDPPPL